MSVRLSLLAAALVGLAGCGVVYTAPSVHDGSVYGAERSTDYDVEVVELTHETAAAANLDPYVAQKLPAAFQPGTLDQRLNSASRSAGAATSRLIPMPSPSAPAESRPGFIPDRLPPPMSPEAYRIGVADVLLLSVNQPTTLENLPALIDAASKRQGYVVQDDGAIAIPDVGRVQVAGQTLMDAEAEIFQAVAGAGIDPSFTLEIAEFNAQRVAVGGLVNAPTLVPITLKPLNLSEAIQLAGGIGPVDPEVATVELFRDGEAYQMGLERFLSEPRLQRIWLKDGDGIYITADYREDQATNRFGELIELRNQQIATQQFEQSRLDLARQVLADERELFRERVELGAVARQYAYLAGEVRETARMPLPFEAEMSLADVLFDKRGLDIQFADYAEIYVLRGAVAPAAGAGVTAYHLDAENAVNLIAATEFRIRPNDVIFVAEQPVTSWNRAISQIFPSILPSLTRSVVTN